MEILRSNKGKALTDEANLFLSGLVRQADERLVEGVANSATMPGWRGSCRRAS